jgi:SpoVK/Ycf46/Vps4 family AAA+-type ATPase
LIKDKMGQFGGGDEFFRASSENPLDEAPFELVRGKGRGLIILLHGVPGVGKTSTAEW